MNVLGARTREEANLQIDYSAKAQKTDASTSVHKISGRTVCAGKSLKKAIMEKIREKAPELFDKMSEFEVKNKVVFTLMSAVQAKKTSDECAFVPESPINFPITIASSDVFYIDLPNAHTAEGNVKKFSKVIKVKGDAVSVKAKLFVKDAKAFEESLKTVPLDFSSRHLLPNPEFEHRTSDNAIVTIMQLFDGDVLELDKKERWDFAKKIDVLAQGLKGIQDLHDHGLIHRDIKAGNMLMKSKMNLETKSLETRVVLGDLDSVLPCDDPKRISDFVGTVGYFTTDGILDPSKASDMYAFGATLAEMFPSICKKATAGLNMEESRLMELIASLKQEDPDRRPTAAEALEALNNLSDGKFS